MRAAVVRADGTGRTLVGEELAKEADTWTQLAGWSPDGKTAVIGVGAVKPEMRVPVTVIAGLSSISSATASSCAAGASAASCAYAGWSERAARTERLAVEISRPAKPRPATADGKKAPTRINNLP